MAGRCLGSLQALIAMFLGLVSFSVTSRFFRLWCLLSPFISVAINSVSDTGKYNFWCEFGFRMLLLKQTFAS